MDAYLKTGGTQRPLTSELVHELIEDGGNSELEGLLSRAAAAEQTSTEDEMDADIASTVRPYAETDVPVQNPEFSMPEGEPPSERQRFTARHRSSRQCRTFDVQPSSSGCRQSASSANRRPPIATTSRGCHYVPYITLTFLDGKTNKLRACKSA